MPRNTERIIGFGIAVSEIIFGSFELTVDTEEIFAPDTPLVLVYLFPNADPNMRLYKVNLEADGSTVRGQVVSPEIVPPEGYRLTLCFECSRRS